MEDRGRRIDPRFASIAIAIVGVITYGSLYPFHFHANPDPGGPLRALIHTWHGPFGRGDFLANVLLYLPLGLFSIQSLRRLPLVARVTTAMLFGVALSVCMELLQFYDESRASALADVYANTIGVAIGLPIGVILFLNASLWHAYIPERRPFVILLLACWLGYRLFPDVPVIDLHKYWIAVKPLIFSRDFPLAEFYRHTATWLAVALLIEALFGARRSRFLIAPLVLLVLFARILIVDAALSSAEVAGAALAAMVWITFLSQWKMRAPVIAALFAGAAAIEALEPFQFNHVARPFGWIPFNGFLHGAPYVNVRSFLDKVFTYGALVWLIARAGSPWMMAASGGAGMVLCLRLAQVFLPGRSAEITDPIMVLLAAGVMKLMGEDPTRVPPDPQPGVWRAILTRNDPVEPVELILVMAGRMDRKHYGLELYKAGVAGRLVLSIGRYEVSKMPVAEWEGIDQLKSLRDRTPPSERHFFMTTDLSGIRFDKTELLRWSTYGEALAFRGFLEDLKARTVMVVSTDVHLRRVALTFAEVFRGSPVRFLYCPVPARFGTMGSDNWFVAKEMTKLVCYRIALSAPRWLAHRLLLLTGWGRK